MRKSVAVAVAGFMTALAYALEPSSAHADFIFGQGYEDFCLSGWTTTLVIAPDRSYVTYESRCEDLGGYGDGGVAWRM
ncbi:MAG: hypothetical protein ACM3O6_17135 [Acidobacteriota bacterium]